MFVMIFFYEAFASVFQELSTWVRQFSWCLTSSLLNFYPFKHPSWRAGLADRLMKQTCTHRGASVCIIWLYDSYVCLVCVCLPIRMYVLCVYSTVLMNRSRLGINVAPLACLGHQFSCCFIYHLTTSLDIVVLSNDAYGRVWLFTFMFCCCCCLSSNARRMSLI